MHSEQQSTFGDPEATTSLDFTRDFHTDNTTRKSLARRVSFASHAQVRLFNTAEGNTNSTVSPQSSPNADSTDDKSPGRPQPQIFNDENAHPGASAFNWQPRSVRHSVGGEMSTDIEKDDTAHCPSAFLRAPNASDSAFQDDDGDTTSNR